MPSSTSVYARSAACLGTTLLSFSVAMPSRVEACGGFFCGQQPVIQTGEQIIFGIDHDRGEVEVTIRISYQGLASDFAWILPLQAEPTRIEVGSNLAFGIIDQTTRPLFVPDVRFDDSCRRGFPVDAAIASGGDAGVNDGGTTGSVTVLRQEEVGPYDTVVLRGTDVASVRTWLETNNYRVTDSMIDAVVPYLAKGNVLVALKLLKENNVGDLAPISLAMPGTEACVPIRLTAIAAQTDMEIVTYVLSDRGRAIPSNYFHIVPNLARLNWLSGGSDYRQLVADAADEAGGNAFVTEFSGAPTALSGQVYDPTRYNLDRLRGRSTLGDFLQDLASQGFFARTELQGILRRAISDALLTDAGVDPVRFWMCPTCDSQQLRSVSFDPSGVVAEIEERILEPDRRAQAMLDRFSNLTRLYTLMSPEEMNLDPIFTFDAALPEVSNVHRAEVAVRCDPMNGAVTRTELTLPDGSTYLLGPNGQLPPEVYNSMPAAERIEQLAEGVVIVDNSRRRTDLATDTAEHGRGSCGCNAVADPWEGAGALFAFVAMALWSATRRKGRAR